MASGATATMPKRASAPPSSVSGVAAAAATGGNGSSTVAQHYANLFEPKPQSMTLHAALFLLESPLMPHNELIAENNRVYLMSRQYLQTWLTWAYHEPVAPEETERVHSAISLAAQGFGLELAEERMDPGPIDALELSSEESPLLLRDYVTVGSKQSIEKARAKSPNGSTDNGDAERIPCCAVPEKFYELLRGVHGVLCEDGHSISFQPPFDADSSTIMYHHTAISNGYCRPTEFRRNVFLVPHRRRKSLSKLQSPSNGTADRVAVVEVYPIKCWYSIDGESGFVLVSKLTPVADAITAILKTVAPEKSSTCVRMWVRRQTRQQDSNLSATQDLGNGYDLVRIIELDGKLRTKDGSIPEHPNSTMLMGEWVMRQNGPSNLQSVDLLVETRATTKTEWKLATKELEHRLQVGDFCDAQDLTGKWYESIVRKVCDDTVTVHYCGWATRWDTTTRRFRQPNQVVGVKQTINAPAPLWTHTKRWRENVQVGQVLEVRESTSSTTKPKWLKGRVLSIGRRNPTSLKPMDGGAQLEALESVPGDDSRKTPLLLLHRRQQILVEIDKEKSNDKSMKELSRDEQGDYVARPPVIRWVSLYGEEICELGTHLKAEEESGPTMGTYAYNPEKGPVLVSRGFLGSGFVRESVVGQPPAPGAVGLHNLGNSCFLNSVIQCLNHVDPITQYFLNGSYENDLNDKNPLGSGGHVARAYAKFLQHVWSGEYSAIAPRLLKQTVAMFAPQFNNVYQHDSHEFCSFLMDGLHEDCNRVKKKPYVEDFEGAGMNDDRVAIESWRRHLLRHDSIIVDYGQGMHRSHVTCPICGKESIKFDIYSSISLPVAPKKDRSSIPLFECLEKFTEGEQLDEHNAWYCTSCKEHVCALKMLALWSVPDILILHLKRFTYEAKSGGGVLRSKIEDRVVFPIDGLDMSEYIIGPTDAEAPPIYNLFGVSEHSGSTANSGHYTATVRNSKTGQWYRYNDSNVGLTSPDASVTGGAYMLFYQRVKGSARWAGMEKIMKDRDIDPHGALDADQDGFVQVKSKKSKKFK